MHVRRLAMLSAFISATALGCRTGSDGNDLAAHRGDDSSSGGTYSYQCVCNDRGSPDCSQKLQLTLSGGENAAIVLEGRTFRGKLGRDDHGDWLTYTGFGAMQDIGYEQNVLVSSDVNRGKNGSIKLVDASGDGPKMTFDCKK